MNYGNPPPPPMNPPPGYGPQPYAPPPKKGMSTGKILLIIFGSLGGLALLCCGGCGAIAWFGMSELKDGVKRDLASNTHVQEHIGTIEDISFNFTKTGEHNQPEVIAYDVKGSKGSGTIFAKANSAGSGVQWAMLRMDNGDEYVLVGDGATDSTTEEFNDFD